MGMGLNPNLQRPKGVEQRPKGVEVNPRAGGGRPRGVETQPRGFEASMPTDLMGNQEDEMHPPLVDDYFGDE